jgi:hypothetical protein
MKTAKKSNADEMSTPAEWPSATDEPASCVKEGKVAELLSCSVSLLQKMRLRGDGPPFIRVGPARVVYPLQELRAWVAAKVKAGGPQ